MSLRFRENRNSSSMKPSERSQLKNARVFSEGNNAGFENKVERRCDTLDFQWMASVSRAGKDGEWKTGGLAVGSDSRSRMSRNPQILVRGVGVMGVPQRGPLGHGNS